MRLIDADRLLSERMKSMYYHLPNGDIAIPIIDIEHAPTIEPERSLLFRIGEICVDESKGFISAGRAVEKIRELLRAERREE